MICWQLAFKHSLSCRASADGCGELALKPVKKSLTLVLLRLLKVIDRCIVDGHVNIAALRPIVGRRLRHAAVVVAAVVAVVVAAIVVVAVIVVAAIVVAVAAVVGVGGLFRRLTLCSPWAPVAHARASIVPGAHGYVCSCHFFNSLCDLLRRLCRVRRKNKMYKMLLGFNREKLSK